MTPEAFVEMVAPHLPIGPYTDISTMPGFDGEMTLKKDGIWVVDCEPTEAAHLLIGALMCEEGDLKKYDIGDGVRTFVARRTASDTPLCLCRSYSTDDTPIGILRALLAARAEAMKEAVNG